MNTTPDTNAPMTGTARPHPPRPSPPSPLLRLPGMIAISFYMLLLAGSAIFTVASGRFSPIYLVFSVFFIAAAFGLLLLLRWAWALTLAAMAMLAGLSLWAYYSQHSLAALVQGMLNLAIFLYLVRTSVREKLK